MYYPKSEITANLHTNGNEFAYVSTSAPYSGYYYATSDGKYFTGKDYSPSAQEIFKISISGTKNSISPVHYVAQPTINDYSNGFFIRYVIKRVNSGIDTIKEINEKDYNLFFNNPLYNLTSFKWKLTGPLYDDNSNPNLPVYGVIDTNRRTLSQQEAYIPGISKIFINLAQHYK